MEARYASTSDEFEGALELFSKCFPNNYFELQNLIGFQLNNAPNLQCIIVKDQPSTIIGAMLIYDRILSYCKIDCNVTGLSYFAIHPKHQNDSASQLIKKKLFEYLDNNSDISVGIARKVMDNYWFPYGYRGFTNFCHITYPLHVLPMSKSKLTAASPTENDLPFISNSYSDSYASSLGALKRDNILWTYYLKKYVKYPVNFEVLFHGQQSVGYLIIQGNLVLEAGIESEFLREATKFIASYMRGGGYHDVIFEIGQQHPLIVYLSQYEHSISSRFVWNGGHIIKIHSVFLFLKKISQVIQLRSVQSNLKDYNFVCNSILFLFKNDSLTIEFVGDQEDNISFQKEEWPKLIFGVVEPKYLIGFKADKNEFILNVLFPKMSPQIPWLDQF